MTASAAQQAHAASMRKLQYQLLPEAATVLYVVCMTLQLGGIGSLIVLLQIGVFGLLVASRPAESLQIFLRWWPLLLTPIVAFLSFLWSDLPAESARYGFQLLFTAFIGVLLANFLPIHRFIIMVFIGMMGFCLLSVASGRMGHAADGEALIGFTGSKNQMALAGFTLFLSAMATFMLRQTPRLIRLAAGSGMLLGLVVLLMTKSASALVLGAVCGPGLIGVYLTQRMTPAARASIFIVVALITIPLVFLAPEIEAAINDFLYNSMGKDLTLTGRTVLWEQALLLIAQKPVEGLGYYAFWLGDSFEAQIILFNNGIGDGRAFHFHNTYLQMAVDTGIVGAATFAAAMAAILFGGIRKYLLHPTTATSYTLVMFLGIAVLSFTEQVLAPMLPRTLFLYACGVYLLTKPPPPAAPPPQRVYRKSWAHA
jgi:exopolysaccharide production protein ExoQ